MTQTNSSDLENGKEKGFKSFAAKRVIVGILLAVVGLWVVGMVLAFYAKEPGTEVT
jgi:hypothetical protein